MSETLKAFMAKQGLAIDPKKQTDRQVLLDKMRQAKIDNKAYLAVPKPTALEQEKQIVKLTRQSNWLIKLALNEQENEE